MLVGRLGAGRGGEQHRPADQLLGERGRRALAPHGRVAHRLVGEERTRIQAEQCAAARFVGKRYLGGEVDPTRPLAERPLEVLHPVRREQEGDVGVRVDAVERVEDLEEQRLGHRPERAVLSDEVAVLEDDDRRLVGTGHLGRVMDELQRPAGEQDDGRVAALTEQVAHRVRLPGTRRPKEEHAPLEVLAIRNEDLAVRRDSEHVLAHPLEEPVRKHDVGPSQRRALDETDPGQTGPVGVVGEGDDLPAQHTALDHQLAHLGHERFAHLGVGRHHVDGAHRPHRLRRRRHLAYRDGLAPVPEQSQAHGDDVAVVVGAGPGRPLYVLDLAERAGEAHLRVLDLVAERHVVPHLAAAESEELRVGVAPGQLLDGDVGVDGPVPRYLLGGDRQPLRTDAEVRLEDVEKTRPGVVRLQATHEEVGHSAHLAERPTHLLVRGQRRVVSGSGHPRTVSARPGSG